MTMKVSRHLIGGLPRDARKHFAPLMAADPRLKLTMWGWYDVAEVVWVAAASEAEAEAIAAAVVDGKPQRLMTRDEELAMSSDNRTSRLSVFD
jgi:hypothetical protein